MMPINEGFKFCVLFPRQMSNIDINLYMLLKDFEVRYL